MQSSESLINCRNRKRYHSNCPTCTTNSDKEFREVHAFEIQSQQFYKLPRSQDKEKKHVCAKAGEQLDCKKSLLPRFHLENVKDEGPAQAGSSPSLCSSYSEYAETQLELDIKNTLSKLGINKIRIVDFAATVTEKEYIKHKKLIAAQCNIPEGQVIAGKRDIPPRLHQYYEFVTYPHQNKEIAHH